MRYRAGHLTTPPAPRKSGVKTRVECVYCGQDHEAVSWKQLVRELTALGWSERPPAVLAEPEGWIQGARYSHVYVCPHCITRWHRERLARQKPELERKATA